MSEFDRVGITFVNGVIASGLVNGVINVQLGVYHFDPVPDIEGKMVISGALTVASRLRMDELAARQLWETLGYQLRELDKLRAGAQAPQNGAGVATGVAVEEPPLPGEKKPEAEAKDPVKEEEAAAKPKEKVGRQVN